MVVYGPPSYQGNTPAETWNLICLCGFSVVSAGKQKQSNYSFYAEEKTFTIFSPRFWKLHFPSQKCPRLNLADCWGSLRWYCSAHCCTAQWSWSLPFGCLGSVTVCCGPKSKINIVKSICYLFKYILLLFYFRNHYFLIDLKLLKTGLKKQKQKQPDYALIWSQDLFMYEGSLKEKQTLHMVTWTLV